jgi:hypothetical protein
MSKQFENSETTKLEDETVLDASTEQRVEHVAEKAAEKSSKTEKAYDKDHSLFTK